MNSLLLQPFTAFIIFLTIGYGIHNLAGSNPSGSQHHYTRHQTYTGGENVPPPSGRVQYQSFFWMALLFSILHMVALVISTLPFSAIPKPMALLYLAGAGASIFVLTEEEF
jgi:hypothetical protein